MKTEQIPYRQEGVREKIEDRSDEIYSTRDNFKMFLDGLGVSVKQLTKEEKHKLQSFAKHAGKRLLNAALNSEDVQYRNSEEVLKALEKHAEELAPFARHDLVHTVVAHNINSNPDTELSRKNSPVPEFIRPNHSGAQAKIEELPAILWTTAFDDKSPFILLMEGRTDKIFDFFERDKIKAIGDQKTVEELRKKVSGLEKSDFGSLIRVYADLVFYIVKVSAKAETENDGLNKEQLKAWDQEFDVSGNEAKRLFYEELERFVHGENSRGKSREEYTLRLFLEKAKAIFDNYSKNPKILLEEFMAMGKPLFDRF